MFRTTVVPDKKDYQLSISMPAQYVGKEVEIIVFAKDEGMAPAKSKPAKKVSFTVLKTKGTKVKFNRDEANER